MRIAVAAVRQFSDNTQGHGVAELRERLAKKHQMKGLGLQPIIYSLIFHIGTYIYIYIILYHIISYYIILYYIMLCYVSIVQYIYVHINIYIYNLVPSIYQEFVQRWMRAAALVRQLKSWSWLEALRIYQEAMGREAARGRTRKQIWGRTLAEVGEIFHGLKSISPWFYVSITMV